MRQILQLGILVVVSLPVMNLILILSIPMMTGAGAHIRQRLPAADEPLELAPVDVSVAVGVYQAQDLLDYLRSSLGGDVRV